MKFLITGDCHRDFSRFKDSPYKENNNAETAVIILGDVGINFMLDKWRDSHIKNMLTKRYKFYIYCVKGNHEARPGDVNGMHLIYDDNVSGEVWIEDTWPTIRYFKEYGEYNINGHSILVIGGAYSVDKYWRLMNDQKWFSNEQLSEYEKDAAKVMCAGKHYDFVFTHTCPITWEPIDMFLSAINQSTVDKGMENFLEDVKNSIEYSIWCFGHYHADRIERPRVEMFSVKTQNLEDIWMRWNNEGTVDYTLEKSPQYYWD